MSKPPRQRQQDNEETVRTGRAIKAAPVGSIREHVEVPSAGDYHGYLNVTGRGNIALPATIRRKYRLDEPGAQVEITERSDGVLELRPNIAVPVDQAWFWTPEWQAGEREADEDAAAGRSTVYDNVEDFMASLEVGE